METFRGKHIVLPRVTNWELVDETNKYSSEQRKACKKKTGKECTLYPFPVGMQVIRFFKPKRWLDPTAGWGDRLRVAIASGVEYVGVDSNPSMQSAYKAIISNNADDETRYIVKKGKFQNVRIDGEFDLVFTSPPFFTEEVYEGMVEWETVDDFMREFMKPMLRKATKHLVKGGHLVLYIEDKPNTPYITVMKEYVQNSLPSLRYEGAFYYQGTRLRPYFVWKKV